MDERTRQGESGVEPDRRPDPDTSDSSLSLGRRRVKSQPYPGTDSFQAEDAELFFGRDGEADQLIAMVLNSRFSLLHARSAAGKTSLLNARVIPGLEALGLTPVRILPQNHPVDSVRLTTLQYLLPPPEAEIKAIDDALACFKALSVKLAAEDEKGSANKELPEERRRSRGLVDEVAEAAREARIGQLRAAFAELSIRYPEKRQMIRPIGLDRTLTSDLAIQDFPSVTPYFQRFLRGSLPTARLGAHLELLEPTLRSRDRRFDSDTTVAELKNSLQASQAQYGDLLEHLYRPQPGLESFFVSLFDLYRRWGHQLALVLILDQFEELFTRFGDPRRTSRSAQQREADNNVLSWLLREDLFREIEFLQLDEEVDRRAMPIRWLLSIRDDYIAELDPVRRFAPDLDASSFHLTFLGRASASDAIRLPAREFGYAYSDECYETILEQLLREGTFVKPAHVQIVCGRLWSEKTGELADVGDLDERRTIDLPTLRKAAGLDGEETSLLGATTETDAILRLFFGHCLRRIQRQVRSQAEPPWFAERRQQQAGGRAEWQRHDISEEGVRLEILELLEPLVTPAGTRNIVSRSELIEAPFRDRKLRRDLLDALEAQRIVRVEKRLGGFFAEIAHEFLIEPLRFELAQSVQADPNYPRFREALMRLEASRREDFRRSTRPLLSADALKQLARHSERLDWRYLGSELLLQSALLDTDSEPDRGVFASWTTAVARSDTPSPERILERAATEAADGGGVLALDELRVVNDRRDTGELGPLSDGQLETILASQLLLAGPGDEEDILYWLGRLNEMQRDPLPTIERYLDFPDRRVRRNVVLALAGLASKGSLERLLLLARDDPEVRDQATRYAAEAAKDRESNARIAEDWLNAELQSEHSDRLRSEARDATEITAEKARQKAARERIGATADLCARLRAHGYSPQLSESQGQEAVDVPKHSEAGEDKAADDATVDVSSKAAILERRLRVADWNRRASLRMRPIDWRQVFPALVGALVGALIAAVALSTLHPRSSMTAMLLLLPVALALAPLMGAVLTARSSPLSRYYDQRAGAVVETLSLGTWSAVPSVLLVLLVLSIWPAVGTPRWGLSSAAVVGVAVVATILFFLALRLGTMVSAYVGVPSRAWIAVRAVTGAAAGYVVLSLSLKATVAFAVFLDEGAFRPAIAGLWLLLLPIGLGVAAAVSWQFHGPTVASISHGVRVGSLIISVIIILAGAVPIYIFLEQANFGSVGARPGQAWSQKIPLTGKLPQSFSFKADFAQTIRADLMSRSEIDLVLTLKGPRVDERADDPEFIETQVPPGAYTLELSKYRSEFGDDEFDQLVEQLGSVSAKRGPRYYFFAAAMRVFSLDPDLEFGQGEGQYLLTLDLNTEPDVALRTQVRALTLAGLYLTAADLLETVEEDYPDVNLVPAQDSLCREGTFHDRLRSVRDACRALTRATSEDPEVADTLGLYYSRLGEFEEAIGQFQRFVDADYDQEAVQLRQDWIEALRAGRNPLAGLHIDDLHGLDRYRVAGYPPAVKARVWIADAYEILNAETAKAVDFTTAEGLYQRAAAASPELEAEPLFWGSLCVFGASREAARDVQAACDRAVKLDHTYLPDRAAARSLADDFNGAVTDLGEYRALTGRAEQFDFWYSSLQVGRRAGTPQYRTARRSQLTLETVLGELFESVEGRPPEG